MCIRDRQPVYKVEICGVNTAKLPLLSNDEKEALFKRILDGDKEAREQYIKGNLRLVLSVIPVSYTHLDVYKRQGIHQTFIPCQRFKCYGIYKISGIARHDHLHIRMLFFKHAGQAGNLIGSNSS